MSDDKRYNGWTNYETWAVNLWLGNEEGTDSYWREIARETVTESEADDTFTRRERATLTLSDRLKDEHEENTPDVSGVYADLLNAALSEVNWYEIAEHFIEDESGDIEKDEQAARVSEAADRGTDRGESFAANIPDDERATAEPPSWLSGEMAGESIPELLGDLVEGLSDDDRGEILTAYEEAADAAFRDAITPSSEDAT